MPPGLFLRLALLAGSWLASAGASAQGRAIDIWSVVVLNCAPASAAPLSQRLCSSLVGEMRKRADAAAVPFIAVPVPSDDVALDRRAGDEGFDFTRALHVRLDISPPTGSLKSRRIALVLRAIVVGPLASIGKDGPYNVLGYSPMVTINDGEAATRTGELAATLADAFFVPMLKGRS